MRTIEISTDVFSRIWAQRLPGEEDENAILLRLLGIKGGDKPPQIDKKKSFNLVLWRHDIRDGLAALGGEAHLKDIYEIVRKIRRENKRSIPINLEAIIRRELEYNSSDATAFQGKHDWFRSANGIGSGVWALRDMLKP